MFTVEVKAGKLWGERDGYVVQVCDYVIISRERRRI